MQPAGARAEGLDAFERQPVGAAHDAGRLALAGRRVGAPHAQPALPGRDLLEVGAAQRLGGQQLDALDGVVVAVHDPPDRAVGLGDGAHELPLLGDRRGAVERAGSRQARVIASAGKAGVAVAGGRGAAATSASARCRAGTVAAVNGRHLGRDQAREAHGLLAALAQGAGAEPVVQQHDRALVQLGTDRRQHLLGAVAAPVVGVDVPPAQLAGRGRRRSRASRARARPTAYASGARATPRAASVSSARRVSSSTAARSSSVWRTWS